MLLLFVRLIKFKMKKYTFLTIFALTFSKESILISYLINKNMNCVLFYARINICSFLF